VKFTLPEFGEDAHWTLMIDTNISDSASDKRVDFEPHHDYEITGRSLLVFQLRT
jgi:hypothetical protein